MRSQTVMNQMCTRYIAARVLRRIRVRVIEEIMGMANL